MELFASSAAKFLHKFHRSESESLRKSVDAQICRDVVQTWTRSAQAKASVEGWQSVPLPQ